MDKDLFELFYTSTGICTDTRAIHDRCLFICIRGENFDGNKFASKALEEGAQHVILDNSDYFIDNGKMTLVDNSVQYLQNLANFHRNKFDIPIIGITGSNGKTTTKELINVVLSKKYKVLATEGNLNNHLGVPFTLLRLTNEHEIAIIEMGANRFKDIEELAEIAEPTHGIITNIGKAHLEGFESFEGVLKTKKELYEAVEKKGGKIIINVDDTILTDVVPKGIASTSYGVSDSADVRGELIALTPFVQMKWSSDDYSSKDLSTHMVGKYNFFNYLAAAAFGVEFNVPSPLISEAIEEYVPTNNRSQVKETGNNILILDCYNANPTSMTSALESFAISEHPSKIVILGDMKELGNESNLEHQKVVQQLEKLGILGYTIGEEFKKIESDNILNRFSTTNEFIDYLKGTPILDRLILLKASRSIGLEVLENCL
jgi:UDP-N-acetylmuramoyl-tripeptide--D-alanyl-D-alanine ligase